MNEEEHKGKLRVTFFFCLKKSLVMLVKEKKVIKISSKHIRGAL